MLRFLVILRSAATKDLLLQRHGRHRGKILRCAQDDKEGKFAQVLCHPEKRSDKGSSSPKARRARGKRSFAALRMTGRENLLRFFVIVILRSAATKDLLLQRRGGHRGKILRCAQDDREGKFAQVLCHPEEHSDEGSSSPKARREQGKDPSLRSG